MQRPSRWSIFIDVEGFGFLYREDPTRALSAVGVLLEGVFKIGNLLQSTHRVFAHQIGDGVLLVSDIPDLRPDRPIAIAIALMRHLLAADILSKAAVSTGDFADVRGCYPSSIQDKMDERGVIRVGDGLRMTIFTVMGSALIAANKLATKRSGACLLVDGYAYPGLPKGLTATQGSLLIVDWIHSEMSEAKELAERAGLATIANDRAEEKLRAYLRLHRRHLRADWIRSTLEGVDCENLADAL